MKPLNIVILGLALVSSVSLTLAFHDNQQQGYYEQVPAGSGYQEGAYRYRFVPASGGSSGAIDPSQPLVRPEFIGGGREGISSSGREGVSFPGREGLGFPGREGISSPPEFQLPNPLGVNTIPELVDKVINLLIILAAPVVTVMVLLGAFHIIMAGGNAERARTGGRIIMWAAVGFGILLLASGVTAIIESLLGVR